MSREFALPDLGEGIAEAQIIRVMVKPGDKIEHDQYLMEVETDKAAVEIPSPFSGKATGVHVKEGQTVNVGDVIVTFEDDGSGKTNNSPSGSSGTTKAAMAEPPVSSPMASPAIAAPSTNASPPSQRKTSAAAPAVRKRARELGLDLDTIVGSGPGGRVTREDVEQHATGGSEGGAALASNTPARRPTMGSTLATPVPGTPGQDKWGSTRTAPLSQIRKTIAKQMSLSAFTAVHVTHNDNADITRLDLLRKELNEATNGNPKITLMPFVIRALCLALRKYPIFNASFDQEGAQIVYKDYINVGIAVDSERGLIVPVIRNADQMSLRQIAITLRGIADKIRSNQFAIEELRGGTFTITNVGALGGSVSTPIINYPEVAILGLGRSKQTPVVKDGEIKPALLLPINLSFDHRATDGANAARFAGEVIRHLESPSLFLLD